MSQLKSVLSSIPCVLIMGASLKWQELPRCSLFHGDDRNFKKVDRNTQFLRNINLEWAHCHSYLHSTNPCKSHGQAPFPRDGKTHSTHRTKQYCKATWERTWIGNSCAWRTANSASVCHGFYRTQPFSKQIVSQVLQNDVLDHSWTNNGTQAQYILPPVCVCPAN